MNFDNIIKLHLSNTHKKENASNIFSINETNTKNIIKNYGNDIYFLPYLETEEESYDFLTATVMKGTKDAIKYVLKHYKKNVKNLFYDFNNLDTELKSLNSSIKLNSNIFQHDFFENLFLEVITSKSYSKLLGFCEGYGISHCNPYEICHIILITALEKNNILSKKLLEIPNIKNFIKENTDVISTYKISHKKMFHSDTKSFMKYMQYYDEETIKDIFKLSSDSIISQYKIDDDIQRKNNIIAEYTGIELPRISNVKKTAINNKVIDSFQKFNSQVEFFKDNQIFNLIKHPVYQLIQEHFLEFYDSNAEIDKIIMLNIIQDDTPVLQSKPKLKI